MNLLNIETEQQFKLLRKGHEILVVWNADGETWSKEMVGKKLYEILKIQKATRTSEYPDEIILKTKGNIFFNFKMFLNGESKIVREVYLLGEKGADGTW